MLSVSITRIVYILLFNHTLTVNLTSVIMRNLHFFIHAFSKCNSKTTLLKRLECKCCIMSRPITLKQSISLTPIVSFSCNCGLDVTHQTTEPTVPVLINSSDNEIFVCGFCFVALFHVWSKYYYLS